VKVVDFGIAKAAYSENKTRTGQIKGKVSYMSPEQVLAKEIDRRTDVWALGVTLFWLLMSSKPFRGENEAQVIHQILSAEPPPLPSSVPAELQRILAKSLAKNPDERYATAAALQADLERWLALSGQNVNASSLAAYMNELFPEASDPDRLLTRAILSGELRQMLGQQNTPSRSMLGKAGAQSRTITADRQKPEGRSRRYALAAVMLLLFFLGLGGTGVFLWSRDHTEVSEPTAAAAAEATPNSALAPVPAPSGATPLVAAPTVPAAIPQPSPTTKPVLTAVRPAPSPALEPRNLHERKHKPQLARRHEPVAAAAPPAPAPEPPPEARGPPGRLVIRVLPWASVFIDGRMVGTTPFEPIDVPAGRHRVQLVNDELHVKRDINVNVKSGETSTVQEKLE
jgi:serine/threonine-protein kinase